MSSRDAIPAVWSHAFAAGTFVLATVEQLIDLGDRMTALVEEWARDCIEDRDAHPEADRRTVRVSARAFPSAPELP